MRFICRDIKTDDAYCMYTVSEIVLWQTSLYCFPTYSSVTKCKVKKKYFRDKDLHFIYSNSVDKTSVVPHISPSLPCHQQ